MPKVYVVQELTRYHCPICDTHITQFVQHGLYQCNNGHQYQRGIPKPMMDITPAAVYGELEVLIKANQIGVVMQPVVNTLRHALRQFGDEDYLLPVGDPIAIGIAISLAAENNRGRIKLLRWDKQTQQYIKVSVNLRGQET